MMMIMIIIDFDDAVKLTANNKAVGYKSYSLYILYKHTDNSFYLNKMYMYLSMYTHPSAGEHRDTITQNHENNLDTVIKYFFTVSGLIS
jgi:hypothetical protein